MFSNNLLMAAAGGGVDLIEVGNSGLFNSANNEYLSKTPAGAGNRDTWTASFWWYRGNNMGAIEALFGGGVDSNNFTACQTTTSDTLIFFHVDGGSVTDQLITSRVFRDVGWYHIVWAVDTTDATEANRYKIYVNGVQETAFGTADYPAQGVDTDINSVTSHYIGKRLGGTGYLDGYVSEFVLIDGLQYAATDFGEFSDDGLYWTPKSSDAIKALTFGTNGFYQQYADSAHVGRDTSGTKTETGGVDFDGTNGHAGFTSTVTSGAFTIACWIKVDSYSGNEGIIQIGPGGASMGAFCFDWADASGHLAVRLPGVGNFDTSDQAVSLNTWTLVAVTHDGTGDVSNDRTKIYKNGVGATTSLASGTGALVLSSNGYIGRQSGGTSNFYFDGEMAHTMIWDEVLSAAELVALYNSATPLTPTADSGDYTSSSGLVHYFDMQEDTGSALDDSEQAANGTLSGGYLWSVNNNFTNNNTVVTSTHTPTNQFALFNPLNPLAYNTGRTLSNGNKTFVDDDAGGIVTTLPLPETGKWKAEFSLAGSTPSPQFGIVDALVDGDFYKNVQYWCTAGANNGTIREGGSTIDSSLTTWTSSDTVTLLIDMDARTAVFKIADVDIGGAGSPYTIADNGRPVFIGVYDGSATCTITLNNGDGGFTYTDADYNALNTTNIAAETTRTVSDPYEHWNNFLYTGTGSSNSLTGVGFQPDFAIIKRRDALATSLYWYDVVRGAGAGNAVYSSANAAEGTYAEYGVMSSFDNDGITVTTGTTDDNGTNNTSSTYVTWLAKLGGAAASNEDGSITSAVSANTTLRMSCGTYTGTGSAATIGHGLGATPGMVLIKDRDVATYDWQVYHSGVGNTASLGLNTTDAISTDISYWNDTDPTSSVFTVGTSVALNKVSTNYVFYAFAPSEFISIGSYEGNNDSDGTLAPCINSAGIPLLPVFSMIKNIDAAANWVINDAERQDYNAANRPTLFPNDTATEGTTGIDFGLGFKKMREVGNTVNDPNTYIHLTIGTPAIDRAGRLLTAR